MSSFLVQVCTKTGISENFHVEQTGMNIFPVLQSWDFSFCLRNKFIAELPSENKITLTIHNQQELHDLFQYLLPSIVYDNTKAFLLLLGNTTNASGKLVFVLPLNDCKATYNRFVIAKNEKYFRMFDYTVECAKADIQFIPENVNE